MNHGRKRIGLAILLAQSITAVSMAHAQLEEIIVTAERREASLQETDIAITAFSETTFNELGVSSYLDLADHAPNVMMHEMPGKAGGSIAIRGFKNAETIATFEPKVGLYLDGVLIAKGAGSVFDVLDLERVEILRGPQARSTAATRRAARSILFRGSPLTNSAENSPPHSASMINRITKAPSMCRWLRTPWR